MKTKEQVAAEIKNLLIENGMTLKCFKKFDPYDDEPDYKVMLIEFEDVFKLYEDVGVFIA